MKKLLLSFSILMLCQSTSGQPAIYKDSVLTVPEAAIIDSGSGAYYTDLRLTYDDAGGFILLAAEAQNLVTVDSVLVNILESFPVQITLTVTGNKSVPCVELLTPAISREGTVFTVVLAESKLGPAESCIAMIDSFETTIPLEVLGLSEGTYLARVNGVEAEFVLEVDNVSLQP